jgi:hypothetical protein
MPLQPQVTLYSQPKDELKNEAPKKEEPLFRVVKNEKIDLVSYQNAQGTVVDYFDVKRIVSSEYVKLEKLTDNSIKIVNNGVQRLTIKNSAESTVQLFATGDANHPLLAARVVGENLISELDLVTSIRINGDTIKPTNGKLDLGNYLGAIANIYSSDSTVTVLASGQERVVNAKPIRVNNAEIKPTKGFPNIAENGVLLNLIDTPSVKVKNYQIDSPSENPKNAKVGFEVRGFIKSINNREADVNGNLAILGIGGEVFFSGDKVLTTEEAASILTTGYDLTNTPTSGNTVPLETNLASYLVRIFKSGLLLPIASYTITGTKLRLTGLVSANEVVSWWIQKL